MTLLGVKICKGCTLMYCVGAILLFVYFTIYPWEGSFPLFLMSCTIYFSLMLKKINYRLMYGFMFAFAVIDLYENLLREEFYFHLALFSFLLLLMIIVKYKDLQDKISKCSKCKLSFRNTEGGS